MGFVNTKEQAYSQLDEAEATCCLMHAKMLAPIHHEPPIWLQSIKSVCKGGTQSMRKHYV